MRCVECGETLRPGQRKSAKFCGYGCRNRSYRRARAQQLDKATRFVRWMCREWSDPRAGGRTEEAMEGRHAAIWVMRQCGIPQVAIATALGLDPDTVYYHRKMCGCDADSDPPSRLAHRLLRDWRTRVRSLTSA